MADHWKRMRQVRTTGRALLGLGSALLCVGWSFPPDEDAVTPRADEPTLAALPSVDAGPPRGEIAPLEDDTARIELDSTATLPELPSAGDATPPVLHDDAL